MFKRHCCLEKKADTQHENLMSIAGSFLDHEWLRQLNPKHKTFFIAAGVLYYFDEDKIRDFLLQLAPLFAEGEMVFDASSPFGIKMANKMVLKASGIDKQAFLVSGLQHAKPLVRWSPFIKVFREFPMFINIRSQFKVKEKLLTWFSDAFKIQYMVHLRFRN